MSNEPEYFTNIEGDTYADAGVIAENFGTSHWIGYHGGCPDGYTAAYMIATHLLASRKNVSIDMVPLRHGQDGPVVTADNVWLVDFANLPAKWFNDQVQLSSKVIVLDHHATASRLTSEVDRDNFTISTSWQDWMTEDDYLFVVDQELSGAGLAARYIEAEGSDASELFWPWPNVQDRDLWKFEHPATPAIMAYMGTMPYRSGYWHVLATDTLRSEVVAGGKAVLEYNQRLIETALDSVFQITLKQEGQTAVGPIVACNVPYAIGSDAAGKIAETVGDGIGAYVIPKGDGWQIGLRSRGDGPDVSRIAEMFGGGGHTHASGCFVKDLIITPMLD